MLVVGADQPLGKAVATQRGCDFLVFILQLIKLPIDATLGKQLLMKGSWQAAMKG